MSWSVHHFMVYIVLFLLSQTERFTALPGLLSSGMSCIIQFPWRLLFLLTVVGFSGRWTHLKLPQHLLPPPFPQYVFGLHEIQNENARQQYTPVGQKDPVLKGGQDGRDGSAIKITNCLGRGPEFSSQEEHREQVAAAWSFMGTEALPWPPKVHGYCGHIYTPPQAYIIIKRKNKILNKSETACPSRWRDVGIGEIRPSAGFCFSCPVACSQPGFFKATILHNVSDWWLLSWSFL